MNSEGNPLTGFNSSRMEDTLIEEEKTPSPQEPTVCPEQEEEHQVLNLESDGKFSFAHNTVGTVDKFKVQEVTENLKDYPPSTGTD